MRHAAFLNFRPHEDSNPDFSLRRAALYPLSYGDITTEFMIE